MPFFQLSKLEAHIKEAAKQAGNVLFMILLAVALFATLAYAVTQSTRSGGGDISKENADLGAAQIIQFAGQVESEVQRKRISENCDINNLDFGTMGVPVTPLSPTSKCAIFTTQGGSIAPQIVQEEWKDTSVSPTWGATFKHKWVTQGGNSITNVGTPAQEVMIVLGQIKLPICEAINRRLGITTMPSQGYGRCGNGWGGISNCGGMGGGGISGLTSGCYQATDATLIGHHFFHVIIPQ